MAISTAGRSPRHHSDLSDSRDNAGSSTTKKIFKKKKKKDLFLCWRGSLFCFTTRAINSEQQTEHLKGLPGSSFSHPWCGSKEFGLRPGQSLAGQRPFRPNLDITFIQESLSLHPPHRLQWPPSPFLSVSVLSLSYQPPGFRSTTDTPLVWFPPKHLI